MFFKNLLKCIGLFLVSIVVMTIFYYSTVFVCMIIEVFNEYVFICYLGVVYSAVVLWARNKMIKKFKIFNKLYLIFTTLIPAIVCHLHYIFLSKAYSTLSMFDKNIMVEIIFDFLFIGYAFFLATIIVTIIELLRLLIKKRI